MKYVAFTILACTFTLFSKAQSAEHKYEERIKEFREKLQQAKDTAHKNFEVVSPDALLKKAKYSHSTSRGDVYVLPYDNMPCLVPDRSRLAKMPGSAESSIPRSGMPNATPPYRVPQKKN